MGTYASGTQVSSDRNVLKIQAQQQAEEVLYQPTPIQAGIDLPLAPDIAAALGIKAVDHE